MNYVIAGGTGLLVLASPCRFESSDSTSDHQTKNCTNSMKCSFRPRNWNQARHSIMDYSDSAGDILDLIVKEYCFVVVHRMSCQDKAAFDDHWESAGQLHGDDR